MTTSSPEHAHFDDLTIAPSILKILTSLKFTQPTPIQAQTIPLAMEGKDIVGIAQTGTGKTLAFSLPMIQRLMAHKGQGLVLVPTRELALQVNDTLQKVGGPLHLRTAVLIGGAAMQPQIQGLKRKPHIIVATPGRLADHLKQGNYALDQVKILVLDEADRMLDIGFLPQIKKIMADLPRERQILLFSATMPPEVSRIATTYMQLPLRIEVAPAGTPAGKIEQGVFLVEKHEKMQLLEKLLSAAEGTVLIFSRTKHGAKKITRELNAMGHKAAEIHSNRSLSQRREALDGFKSGKYKILVATDIAARGIDVKDIWLVINFDLPDNSEDYVHRIGRTGRAGSAGKAVSFAAANERSDLKYIERLIRRELPIFPLPALPPRRAPLAPPARTPRGGSRRSFSGKRASKASPRRGFRS